MPICVKKPDLKSSLEIRAQTALHRILLQLLGALSGPGDAAWFPRTTH